MTTSARQAHRLATIERIKRTAHQLLARDGATGLSLREVAREMGQTSSALYRYFVTRDELLTALIVDAYNDLGATVERAESRVTRGDLEQRWRSTCRAVRRWARANPHDYALIFGSPIPGYVAPELTVAAATRVTAVMASIVADHYRNDDVGGRGEQWVPPETLETSTLDLFLPGVPTDVRAWALLAWSQVFGFVSFELFGHFAGTVRQAGVLFDFLIDETRRHVGIPQTIYGSGA